jgi:hypothetical protein
MELPLAGLWGDHAGSAEGDQLEKLGVVADLWSRAGWVGAIGLRHPWQGQVRDVCDLGHPEVSTGRERVAGWEYGDLAFAEQLLGVEAICRVERPMQEGNVGSPVAKDLFLLADPAQDNLNRDRSRLSRIGLEQFGE